MRGTASTLKKKTLRQILPILSLHRPTLSDSDVGVIAGERELSELGSLPSRNPKEQSGSQNVNKHIITHWTRGVGDTQENEMTHCLRREDGIRPKP